MSASNGEYESFPIGGASAALNKNTSQQVVDVLADTILKAVDTRLKKIERKIATLENIKSITGNGGYYMPNVDADGNLTWSASSKGMPKINGANIQGERGEEGEPGKDGVTPHIGENGNWFIGDVDTGTNAIGSAGTAITPEMHGAVGDGVTDDTAAIQAAIDDAIASRKRLVFEKKTYRISSTLKVNGSNIDIDGCGATIKPLSWMSQLMEIDTTYGLYDDESDYVDSSGNVLFSPINYMRNYVRNLTFDCVYRENAAAGTFNAVQNGLVIKNGYKTRFENISVFDPQLRAINVQGGCEMVFDNIHLSRSKIKKTFAQISTSGSTMRSTGIYMIGSDSYIQNCIAIDFEDGFVNWSGDNNYGGCHVWTTTTCPEIAAVSVGFRFPNAYAMLSNYCTVDNVTRGFVMEGDANVFISNSSSIFGSEYYVQNIAKFGDPYLFWFADGATGKVIASTCDFNAADTVTCHFDNLAENGDQLCIDYITDNRWTDVHAKVLSETTGEAPHIGENGNWFIGETDSGVAATGPEGVGIKSISLDENNRMKITYTDGRSQSFSQSLKGADGFSPSASIVVVTDANGVKTHNLTITDKYGSETTAIKDGEQGPAGKDGYTPVKGTDYFTPGDKGEIVSQVIAGLPTGTVSNAVTLSTAQTVTGVKTFTASNFFDGEQKLSFKSYCPTVTDIANGIGASMKNARAVDCQLYVSEIYAPYCGADKDSVEEPVSGLTAKNGQIDFYMVTGATAGQPTERELLMSLKPDGLYVLGKKVVTQ